MFVFIPPPFPPSSQRHATPAVELNLLKKKESAFVQGEQGQVEQQNRTDLHRYAQACAQAHQDLSPSSHNL